ncbi:hypothetical protein BX600DRAFT_219129 [Xylariales sp. PMI_506]|nr:hypothetical protein BX600DRAFT_219129 [Xylariales sp. PMI_506]
MSRYPGDDIDLAEKLKEAKMLRAEFTRAKDPRGRTRNHRNTGRESNLPSKGGIYDNPKASRGSRGLHSFSPSQYTARQGINGEFPGNGGFSRGITGAPASAVPSPPSQNNSGLSSGQAAIPNKLINDYITPSQNENLPPPLVPTPRVQHGVLQSKISQSVAEPRDQIHTSQYSTTANRSVENVQQAKVDVSTPLGADAYGECIFSSDSEAPKLASTSGYSHKGSSDLSYKTTPPSKTAEPLTFGMAIATNLARPPAHNRDCSESGDVEMTDRSAVGNKDHSHRNIGSSEDLQWSHDDMQR